MARADWLDEGLAILADLGAPAVTIDRLCDRLGLTKGAFYHHFRGIADYRSALLEHFELTCTTALIARVEQSAAKTPLAKLERLADVVVDAARESPPALEIAVRAWALQDELARRAQERIDRSRFSYVRSLTRQLGLRPQAADDLADLLCLATIGSDHAVPPVAPDDLRRMLGWLLRAGAGGTSGGTSGGTQNT